MSHKCLTGREQMQQRRAQKAGLLDHLVGAGEQCGRHFEAEGPDDLVIDHQLLFH